jgi:hypothetical protein
LEHSVLFFSASEFYMLTFRENSISSIFPASEFYMPTFQNTVCSIFTGVWILYADVSEHCSIFSASECYIPTFRKTLSLPSSRRLNFICRRFRTLSVPSSQASEFYMLTFWNTLFYFFGVWMLYTDVSENSVSSIFPASEFYMSTFRNTLYVQSLRHLNFIPRRLGTHYLFHLPGIWISYADDLGHSVPFFRRLNVMYQRFGTLCLFHLPGVWILYADVSEHYMFRLSGIWILYPTFRNTMFHLSSIWILYTDVSEKQTECSETKT